jgi:DNA-binding NtrC family response regulator
MATTTVRKGGGGSSPEAVDAGGDVFLVVMGSNLATTHRLPARGALVIGRDEDADVRLIDPEASRHHARLHVGGSVEIEDLGSANGTRVRDRPLAPGARATLELGDAVVIGATILVLQSRPAAGAGSRLASHAYFESRLIEECARAEGALLTFGVLRLRFDRPAPAEEAHAILLEAMRPGDVLARYAPADLEALLVDSDPGATAAFVARIERALAGRGLRPAVGLALFPRDGTSPQALMACASRRVLSGGSDEARPAGDVVVRNAAMRELFALAERVAGSTLNVLLLGETGVGKEIFAHEIHRRSARAQGPFVCLNCAAVAETLVESELFGHERGAFTGAAQTKPGLLEAASGGTMFLDEIGDMPLALQAKLLRAIETGEVMRVGGTSPRRIDVRFVAATNRDVEDEIAHKAFRADLYFRLNGASLEIPPLRERRDEIEPLARRFLDEAAARLGRSSPALSAEAVGLLESHHWPGNIRELRNVIERALLMCTGAELSAEHLPTDRMRRRDRMSATAAAPAAAASGAEHGERAAFVDALARCAGNQTRAAELLGIPRRTFCDRLKQLGIPRPRS